MNPFEMVVLIVAIMAVAGVMRARYGAPRTGRFMRRHRAWQDENQAEDPEKEMLRDEVKELKERVAVLERIATDSSSSLEREIEQLRDR